MKIIGAIAVALTVGACGTVTRGTSADVTFNSEPAGARVQVSTGLVCPATPCTFQISRKQEFIAHFEMEGYEPQQIPVKTEVSGSGAAGFAGNIILGGVVGMVVDASTGSTMDHSPNPVFAKMVPVVKPQPATPPRHQRRRRAAGV